ncbi:AI-2E family transporter [Aneurinibacillus sp. Ricciae_BoGa-3]|uniref:AI-2E family transporter n=1 Tax=Aneurinibacillus sp. Ricciae_BoGa-3 TaxID=3022697 RepID=UPI0023410FA2|nr:AI-2E family transporter [Aneurinibacillus sp. Ricciae_BoGa-3]WCK56538.1 AI-2E family transporter [Aneurinibacillus sp. Ricciae_BoGa-3]
MLRDKWFRRGVQFLLVLVIIYMVYKINFVFIPIVTILRAIFLPFIVSGVAYYLLRPIVRWLESKNIKRSVSIPFIYFVLAGMLTAGFFFLRPYLVGQFATLAQRFPTQLTRMENYVSHLSPFADKVTHSFSNMVNQTGEKMKDQSSTILSEMIGVIFSVATVPFILFYMLRDESNFWQFIKYLIPRSKREEVDSVLSEIDETIGDYIRGQITVSFIVGVLLYIGYLITGLDYAGILALIAMVTNFIPYIGPFIAAAPAVLIALSISPSLMVKVLVAYIIVHILEGNVITPHIMGRNLEIHPLTIIVILLFSGELAGVPGLIFGVPVYAIVKVIYSHIFEYLEPKLKS